MNWLTGREPANITDVTAIDRATQNGPSDAAVSRTLVNGLVHSGKSTATYEKTKTVRSGRTRVDSHEVHKVTIK